MQLCPGRAPREQGQAVCGGWQTRVVRLLVAEGPQTSVDQMGHENSQQGLPDSGWEVRARTSVPTTCGHHVRCGRNRGCLTLGKKGWGREGPPVLQCLRLRVDLEWGLRGAGSSLTVSPALREEPTARQAVPRPSGAPRHRGRGRGSAEQAEEVWAAHRGGARASGVSAGGAGRVSRSPAKLTCNRLQTRGLGAPPDHRAGAQHPGLGNVGGRRLRSPVAGGRAGDGATRGGP